MMEDAETGEVGVSVRLGHGGGGVPWGAVIRTRASRSAKEVRG